MPSQPAFQASQPLLLRPTLPLKSCSFASQSLKLFACIPRQAVRACIPTADVYNDGLPPAPLDDPLESIEDPSMVADTDSAERQRLESLPLRSSIPRPPEPTTVTVEFTEGKELRFETGRLARQAGGAVVVKRGDTLVLCTACTEDKSSPTMDFLPLRVDYAEKFSAMGRTSGSYIKREGRPSEREILLSRLIDRPLRPMFQNGYYNETQVLAKVYSYDPNCPPDATTIAGAAAALYITSAPLVKPVAGVRLGLVAGQFVVEPTMDEMKSSECDLIIAGTDDKILMIEGQARFLTEERIIEGVTIAHQAIVKICAGIEELKQKVAIEHPPFENPRVPTPAMLTQMEALSDGIDQALAVIGKKQREVKVKEVKERVFEVMKPSREEEISDPDAALEKTTLLKLCWKKVISDRMRASILQHNIRPDGRDSHTVRPITIDQSPLPRSHGSSVFTRGETQALAVCTLGGDEMAQRFETLEGENAARFYLQYSFPPFSVGEVGRIGAPGRREIGHGKLAERALLPAIPAKETFPYVLRVESNILESNGSSSMASVCGACLAMLDAGVPLSCSVAGVAMGLVVDENESDAQIRDSSAVVLTDILGLEDALGCCDAKFAGNREGLSALQLDVKLQGISLSLFERLLMQARPARHHILDCMDEVQPHPNSNLAKTVPKVMSIQISPKRIGDVIGQGGKTIRSIIEKCGGEEAMKITIENDGRVSFTSLHDELLAKAIEMVRTYSFDMEVGTKLRGKVTKILPFGAYVEIAEGKEGWLHISELEMKRTAQVSDVCNVGDELDIVVIEVGRNGQFRVSRKALMSLQARGDSIAGDGAAEGGEKGPKRREEVRADFHDTADTKR